MREHHVRIESEKRSLESTVEMIIMLQDMYHVHGHGTGSVTNAENILKNGLYTKHDVLGAFTHTLDTDKQRIRRALNFWEYDQRACVVLIAVPKSDAYYNVFVADNGKDARENENRSAEYALKHVFERSQPNDKTPVTRNSNKRIPPRMIIGYWDTQKNVFVNNPQFEKMAVN